MFCNIFNVTFVVACSECLEEHIEETGAGRQPEYQQLKVEE